MIASRAPLVEGAAAPAPGAGQGGTPRRYDLTSPAPPPAPPARRPPEVGAGRGCETAHEYDLPPCPAPTARRPPLRDATLGTLLLIAAIGVGSGGFAGLDPALFGYLGATLVAAFAVAWRASAFWRRPASAFYARALYAALRQPGRWSHLAAAASRDLVVQDFVRRRSPARWLAHLMLSLGTLASFAITLPLVFGWMHMLPAGERHYRIAVFTVPTVQFDVDGAVGWIAFHALSLAGIAVALGAAYFLLARLRTRQLPGSTTAFAVLPLLLLLVVALSGLALPASRTWPAAFRVAAWLHQASVVVLLVALPFSKLGHVLVRPLQLGARAVRRAGAPARRCAACGAPIAPVGQHAAVAALLAQRGVALGVHLDRCPPCRRRQLARVQAARRRRRRRGRPDMATLPASVDALIDAHGPHLNFEPPGGFAARSAPDRRVETHCCFCGQQCGVRLLVKDERVVGVEPWEEFPFNQGKLCPKGIKRYLQNNHPDRLRRPLVRTGRGFAPIPWDDALDLVAERVGRLQQRWGRDSVAVLSGASLTNEKAYLTGKFARLAVGTRHIDYNGRLCMVAAGAANLKAFGIDRAANPWADIAATDLVMVLGSNVSECSPITTDYIWRARDRGARLIVVDPRLTPIARTADLYLPVRPGRDSLLMNAMLHAVIRLGGVDHDFIARHTSGFADVRRTVEGCAPEAVEREVGIPAARINEAARLWVQAPRTMLLHARGIEHHTKGVDNVLSCINLVLATGKIGKPGCGYATITGQGNGQGGREHGQRCNQLPGARDIENPVHRAHVAAAWGVPESSLPGRGATAPEIVEMIHRGEIRGLLSLCFNPLVSLPDAAFTRAALERLDFYVAIDFFLSETARHADLVLPSALPEEDEGTVTSAEGRVIRIRKAVDPPGEARTDWRILCDLARRLGAGHLFDFAGPAAIFEELRRLSAGGVADYAGITWEKIERQMGVFWPCPSLDHPGTPRLFEGGRFAHADGRARLHAVEYRAPAEPTDDEYPIILTTGRIVSQFLSGTQTRRIGPLVEHQPEPRVEMHLRLAERLGVTDGMPVRVLSRRGHLDLRAHVVATIRPDTVFIPYHWPGEQSANRLTVRAYDPQVKIPEFKVCAVRIERSPGGTA